MSMGGLPQVAWGVGELVVNKNVKSLGDPEAETFLSIPKYRYRENTWNTLPEPLPSACWGMVWGLEGEERRREEG